MAANRAILIPELSLTPENIQFVTEEPTSGLVTKAATRGANNEGRLDPNPVADPTDVYDIDVFERTAGNVGGARAGWKDSANTVYRSKSPTHVPHHMQWLEYGTAAAEQFMRPKAISLQSGELLVVVVTGIGVLRWFTFTDGVRNAVHTETAQFAAANVIMADVVQMPDGELIMMILGTDAGNNVRFVKKTSKGDTDATIVWHFGPTELNTQAFAGATLTTGPQGFAIEVMESGRIAMLVKRHGVTSGSGATDIARTFSDDRGVTWADLETASSYEELGTGVSIPTYRGGVDIERDPETGSLIAVCGVAKANSTVMPNSNEPSVIGLVSDNGDNWTGLVKVSEKNPDNITTGNVFDFPFFEEGMQEATVVYGDDGLIKFIGAFHGDSGNVIVAGFFDDLCMLSTRKSGISAKDAAPQIPAGTAMGSEDTLTCGDAFDSQRSATTGFRRPVRTEIALNRIDVTAGTASGNLDSGAVVYNGPRFVEAINHNGTIYLFMACEDTAGVRYALGYMILNVWDELWEKGGLVTAQASALKGNVYSSTAGWMAYTKPLDAGLTVVNTGAQTLDETTRGLKVAPVGAISTFGASFAAYGARPNPLLFRFIAKATSGGSLTQDDIAMILVASNGTNYISLSIRFDVSSSQIRVYDNNSAATVGTDVIDFVTIGVEVIVSLAANLTVNGIFYRALTADPEDAVTVRADGSAAYSGGIAAGVAETWTAGTHTAESPSSTWMGVWISRATATSVSSEGAVLWDGIYAWGASPPQIVEYAQDETPYDDGISHGGRAQVVRSFGQYYRYGMRLSWKGASGREGNTWDVTSANRFEAENVLRTPVARYWRSTADSATVVIEFNAGSGGRFNPQAVALFGINAKGFNFQMSASSSFATTPIDIDVDIGGAATVDRHLQELAPAQYTLAGSDNRELVLSAATSQPLTPHMFRSNDRIVWYAWNTGLAKSIRIVDNEGYKVILAASGVGAASSWWIYPDRIGFNVSGGNLGQGGGYRYMRIRFAAQDLYEGYYKLGQIMVGQLLALSTSGMSPEWGWQRRDEVPVSQANIETGGVRVTNLYDGALQRYSFGWSGLRGRAGHTSLANFQGVRDSFVQLIEAYQRVKGGEVPVALFPMHEDGRAGAAARSFDVIPCAMIGPAVGSQVAYENCLTDSLEGSIREIMNLEPFTFVEIP